MRRAAYSFVLGLAAIAGCIELPIVRDNGRKPATKPDRPPAAPVTAAEVNDSNAADQANALQRELDEEAKSEERTAVKVLGKQPLP